MSQDKQQQVAAMRQAARDNGPITIDAEVTVDFDGEVHLQVAEIALMDWLKCQDKYLLRDVGHVEITIYMPPQIEVSGDVTG